MKNQLLIFGNIITKYVSNIEKSQDLLANLRSIQLKDKPSFGDIWQFCVQYPVTEIITQLNKVNQNDLADFKSAVKALIDAAVKSELNELKAKNVTSLQKYMANLVEGRYRERLLDENPDELSQEAMLTSCAEYLQELLITGSKTLQEGFLWRRDLEFKVQSTDAVQIIRYAQFVTEFELMSIKALIEKHKLRLDCVTVETDETIQYRQGDPFYCNLVPASQPQLSWNYTKNPLLTSLPLKLMAVDVTNCHTVIIKEAKQNKYWLLHVSPASMKGVHPYGYPVKKAYTDLQKNYNDATIGVEDSDILDVIVIDVRGNFNEELLRQRLPGKIRSLKCIKPDIEVPNGIVFSGEEKKYLYYVCFDIHDNVLSVKQDNKFFTYANPFDTISVDVKLTESPISPHLKLGFVQNFSTNTKSEKEPEQSEQGFSPF